MHARGVQLAAMRQRPSATNSVRLYVHRQKCGTLARRVRARSPTRSAWRTESVFSHRAKQRSRIGTLLRPTDSGSKSTRLASEKTATLFNSATVVFGVSATVVFEPEPSTSHSCTRTCSSVSGSGPPPYVPTEARAHRPPALRRTRTCPCAHVHEQPSRSHLPPGTPHVPLHLDCPVTCHSLVDAQPTWMHAPAVQQCRPALLPGGVRHAMGSCWVR